MWTTLILDLINRLTAQKNTELKILKIPTTVQFQPYIKICIAFFIIWWKLFLEINFS